MEKISSIVSSTSQSKVDMSKERPVRAGAPSYGQPTSEATQTFAKPKAQEEQFMTSTPASILKLNKDDIQRHSGMIEKITLSFKGNSERKEPIEQVIELDAALEASPLLESPVDNGQESESVDVYA